jgi:hypothetical protein
MKPRPVFVHGIGGPRDADAELDAWLRALADGARAAGHSRRVLDLVQGWAADARFAYYADLFDRRGLDKVIDGSRTGRFDPGELTPTERSYLSENVELAVRAGMGLPVPEPGEWVSFRTPQTDMPSRHGVFQKWCMAYELHGRHPSASSASAPARRIPARTATSPVNSTSGSPRARIRM